MFLKQFKIKSNVQLKGSDHKKIKQRILQNFTDLNETGILTLFPCKSPINVLKIITFNGIICNVYSVDKRPMFFEDSNNQLIPTLYSLWLLPDLLPSFTTHPAVLPRLTNGADLMLPGVIRIGSGMNSYGHHKKGDLIAVNLTSNKAAAAVGQLLRSSDDLYMSGGHGPCVKILNIIGDCLWGIEPAVSLQIPNFEPVIQQPTIEDFPPLGKTVNKNKDDSQKKDLERKEVGESWDSEEQTIELPPVQENMYDVIKSAFLTALKMDGKRLVLPVLTSNFYRLHILPAAKVQINLKQTEFKKLSKFLHEMDEQNFIVLRQETKGIEKIVSINFDHPELVNFIPKSNEASFITKEPKHSHLFDVSMTELYKITDETMPFFTQFGLRKNDGITSIQTKKLLKEYFSKLQQHNVDKNKQILKIDSCLASICNFTESMFDNIHQTLLSKMKHSFEMRETKPTQPNKPPIQMSLATRSGNKKVTIVTNLQPYGIILSEFSRVCKIGAAASTSIVKSPNQKQDHLQIQGNQVKYIYKVLTETYHIPSTQIRGIELAKKEKIKKM